MSIKCTRASQENRVADSNIVTIEINSAIRIKEFTFGNLLIYEDGSTNYYLSPKWLDLNDDQDAEDSGEHRFPVGFVRGTSIHQAKAKLVADNPITATGAMLKGIGPDGVEFHVTFDISGSTFETPFFDTCPDPNDTSTCFKLPNKIKFYHPFVIGWELSLDHGQTFIPVGTTDNRVYVTYANPQTTFLYETVLDIANRENDDVTDINIAADNNWLIFESRNVQRKPMDGYNNQDGMQMKFWLGDWRGVLNPPQNLEGMLVHTEGDGSCFSWAALFNQALKVHGIDSTIYEITSKDISPEMIKSCHTANMMFKNW